MSVMMAVLILLLVRILVWKEGSILPLAGIHGVAPNAAALSIRFLNSDCSGHLFELFVVPYMLYR